MPYSSVNELPSSTSKLSPKKKRQWMHVFNSSLADHGDEGRAAAAAWSVVGRKEMDDLVNYILPKDNDSNVYFGREPQLHYVKGISKKELTEAIKKSKPDPEKFGEFKEADTVEGEKCYDTPVYSPYGGATSFDEVETMRKAQEAMHEMEMETETLHGIIYNITSDDEIEVDEKARRIQTAADDYRKRISGMSNKAIGNKSLFSKIMSIGEKRDYNAEQRRNMASRGQAMPDGSFPIADVADLRNAIQSIGRASNPAAAKRHIKKRARALGKTDLLPEGWKEVTEELPTVGGFKVYIDNEGQYRWLSLSSNSFEDLDKELFTTKALEEAIEHADKSGERGPLLIYHVPSAEIGQCDFQAMAGRFLMESGTFDDTPMGRKAAEYLVNSEEDHQVSIGYHYKAGDESDGQYDWVRIFERSVLPFGAAANPWTSFKVIGENTMDEKHKAVLAKYLGEELTAEAIQNAEAKTKELEQSVRFKEKSEDIDQSLANVKMLITNLQEGDVRAQLEKDYEVLEKATKKEPEPVKEEKKEAEAAVVATGTENTEATTAVVATPDFTEQFRELAQIITDMSKGFEGVKSSVATLEEDVKSLKASDDDKMWRPRFDPTTGRPTSSDSNIITEDKIKELVGTIAAGPEDPVKKYVDDIFGPRNNGA